MRPFNVLPWTLLSFSTLCRADAFTDAASKLPLCGTTCIIQEVPQSACHTITNTTCLCTDTDLYAAVLACVAVNCTAIEALDTARVEAAACQRPVRSRKSDLYIPLSVEILGFICAILRLFSRWWTMAHYEADDYIMIVTTALYVVFEVLGQYAGQLAFGVDIWTVDEATLTQAFKLFYIDESFYLAVLSLTKISILSFYLRVFPNPWLRRVIYATMVWVATSGIVFLFLQIFQCIPIDYNWLGWKGNYGSHQCLDVNNLTFTAAGFGIAQDFVILILPLPVIASLNTTMRTRMAICLMFSLGIFVLITSCIRLRSIAVFGSSMNPTWDYSDVLIWTGLELAVGLIVASLPAIRVLISRLMPGTFGTTFGTSYGGTSGSHGPVKRSERSVTGAGGGDGTVLSQPKRRSRLFSLMSSRGEFVNESQLELGDKVHGNVRTEIGAGSDRNKPTSTDVDSIEGVDGPSTPTSADLETVRPVHVKSRPSSGATPGIHVRTIMTRTSTALNSGEKGYGKQWQPLG